MAAQAGQPDLVKPRPQRMSIQALKAGEFHAVIAHRRHLAQLAQQIAFIHRTDRIHL